MNFSRQKEFPGFNLFHTLLDPLHKTPFRGEIDLSSDKVHSLTRGKWISRNGINIKYALGGTRPRDVIWTTIDHPVIIVSQRVIDLLKRERLTGWSTYPVTVYGRSEDIIEGYLGLSVTGRCGKIENAQSLLVQRHTVCCTYSVYKGLYFDPETWDGSDCFMTPGREDWIFITDAVKKAFGREKIRNIKYRRLDLIERANL